MAILGCGLAIVPLLLALGITPCVDTRRALCLFASVKIIYKRSFGELAHLLVMPWEAAPGLDSWCGMMLWGDSCLVTLLSSFWRHNGSIVESLTRIDGSYPSWLQSS
jgi:hypothetical protein